MNEHIHLMEKVAEVIETLTMKGVYKMYEDSRRKYVFRCECKFTEIIFRLPWDTLVFEEYRA